MHYTNNNQIEIKRQNIVRRLTETISKTFPKSMSYQHSQLFRRNTKGTANQYQNAARDIDLHKFTVQPMPCRITGECIVVLVVMHCCLPANDS